MTWEGESGNCPTCGRTLKTRVPAGGDGTGVFVAKHKFNGRPCDGSSDLIADFDNLSGRWRKGDILG